MVPVPRQELSDQAFVRRPGVETPLADAARAIEKTS
jgi:hypothetical protein